MRPFIIIHVLSSGASGSVLASPPLPVYGRGTSDCHEDAEAAMQALHHRFTDQPPQYIQSFAYALRDAVCSARDLLEKGNLFHSLSEAQTWPEAVSVIENSGGTLVGHVRDAHVSRLRDLQSHAQKPAFVWLTTQADLFFIAIEKSFVEVPMMKRLALITAIANRLETMTGLGEPELYAVAATLKWSEMPETWELTTAVLLDDLMTLGHMTINEFRGVLNETWLMLVGAQSGSVRSFNTFLMRNHDIEYFAQFQALAAEKLAELTERAGVLVDDFFPFRGFLGYQLPGELSNEARLELFRAEMESKSEAIVRRAQMFARWEPRSISKARGMYLENFKVGSWKDFHELDLYLDELSRGIPVGNLPADTYERIREEWSRDDAHVDLDLFLEIVKSATRATEVSSQESRGVEFMRLNAVIDKIAISDPNSGELLKRAAQHPITPLQAARLYRFLNREGTLGSPTLGRMLSRAYAVSRIAGIKLLALDEGISMHALGIDSLELLGQYRTMVSLLLHLSCEVKSSVFFAIAGYIGNNPERANEFLTSLKRLVAASKDYEVRPHAVYYLSAEELLGDTSRIADLGKTVDKMIANQGQNVWEERMIRNAPLPDSLNDMVRSYMNTPTELIVREFSQLVRSEFWMSGTDRMWGKRSWLAHKLNAVLPYLNEHPPIATEVLWYIIQYYRLAAKRTPPAIVANRVHYAVRDFCTRLDVRVPPPPSLLTIERIRTTLTAAIAALG